MFIFTLRLIYPEGENTQYPLDRRLGGPCYGLDDVEKRKISCPYRESKPVLSALIPLLYPLSYPGSIIEIIAIYILRSLGWRTNFEFGVKEESLGDNTTRFEASLSRQGKSHATNLSARETSTTEPRKVA
jgi:hypothetical protein